MDKDAFPRRNEVECASMRRFGVVEKRSMRGPSFISVDRLAPRSDYARHRKRRRSHLPNQLAPDELRVVKEAAFLSRCQLSIAKR